MADAPKACANCANGVERARGKRAYLYCQKSGKPIDDQASLAQIVRGADSVCGPTAKLWEKSNGP